MDRAEKLGIGDLSGFDLFVEDKPKDKDPPKERAKGIVSHRGGKRHLTRKAARLALCGRGLLPLL